MAQIDFTKLDRLVKTLLKRLKGLTGSVETLGVDVDAVEADVATLIVDVDAVEADVATLIVDVDAVEADVADLIANPSGGGATYYSLSTLNNISDTSMDTGFPTAVEGDILNVISWGYLAVKTATGYEGIYKPGNFFNSNVTLSRQNVTPANLTNSYSNYLVSVINLASVDLVMYNRTAGELVRLTLENVNAVDVEFVFTSKFYNGSRDLMDSITLAPGETKEYIFLSTAGNKFYDILNIEGPTYSDAVAASITATPGASYTEASFGNDSTLFVGDTTAAAVDIPFDLAGFNGRRSYDLQVIGNLVGACTLSFTNADIPNTYVDLNGVSSVPAASFDLTTGVKWKVIIDGSLGLKTATIIAVT